MVALGCAGFYKKDLDGINILLFGLTMFYITLIPQHFFLWDDFVYWGVFLPLHVIGSDLTQV